jgi:membrane fusion protein (multidrug efflux system)
MKTRIIFAALISALIFNACDNKTDSKELEAKKTKLAELITQQKDLQTQITNLEAEIKAIDPKALFVEKSKKIGIDTLKLQDFYHFIEVQGTIDAMENVLAIQQIPGIVTGINVKEGDRVSKGQVLYLTDASTYQKQMDVVQTQLDLAKVAFDKQKKLWEQNIGSELQYLQAKAGKETLEKQYSNLNAALELTKCKSPIDGIVDEVRVKLGDMAAPSQMMPGVRVVNASKMVVKAKLADSQIGRVKVGDKVMVSFPDINQKIEALVTYVGQTVDKQTRTFNVEVRINNPSNEYKANMIAKLLINDDLQKSKIIIQENVIQKSIDGHYVLVAENGRALKRDVETGNSYDGKIIVTQGLKPGDKLITFGYTEVVDGQKIDF